MSQYISSKLEHINESMNVGLLKPNIYQINLSKNTLLAQGKLLGKKFSFRHTSINVGTLHE